MKILLKSVGVGGWYSHREETRSSGGYRVPFGDDGDSWYGDGTASGCDMDVVVVVVGGSRGRVKVLVNSR